MEPLKLSQVIEENTLELLAWLYLFPITLVDLLIRPTVFLEAMAIEKSKTDSTRFDTRMSPVLFFLLGTVPLSIAVIKAGNDADSETMPAMTDAAMIMSLVLAAFPFVWSLTALTISGCGFGRTAFREAFSTQCYLFCPPWLALLIGTLADQNKVKLLATASILLCFALAIWGLIAEWRLFQRTSASFGKRIICFAAALALSVGALKIIIAIAHATGQKWIAS